MRIKHLKQYLLTPGCLKCGSFFCEDTLFCSPCFAKEIEPRINLASGSHLKNSLHFYLLDWHKTESFFLDQMVYRLKSDNSPAAWSIYSALLLQKIDINFQNFKGLIPIPGSKPGSVHSLLFARELSALTGLPVLNMLIKKSEASEQKKGTFFERKNQNIIKLDTHQVEHFTKYIFVDDVLTTGQSFLQSNRAINAKRENIILTLFYRPKSD